MPVFTVHEPPTEARSRMARGEELVFIRDNFSWRAAIFPPGWFAMRGDWIGILVYVAILAVVIVLLSVLGAKEDWVGLALLAVHVYFGYEASEVLRWSLSRKGWREIAAVSGPNRDACERRFFDNWLRRGQDLLQHAPPPLVAEVRHLASGSLEDHFKDWLNHVRGKFGSRAG